MPRSSPRLPWEVIERIIDHSSDRPKTLHNLALTCRQLRPRSRCVAFGLVKLKSNNRVFAFIDFIFDNPDLKPHVYTIIVSPASLGPSLLYVLPNLSSIECEGAEPGQRMTGSNRLHLHHSSLAAFRSHGTHVQTLRLQRVSFSSGAFIRVLLALTSLTHLTCTNVEGVMADGNKAHLEGLKRRLSEQMCLKTLIIDSSFLTCGGLLLDRDLAPSTVETLQFIGVILPILLQYCRPTSGWPRLRSLILQSLNADRAIELLAYFSGKPFPVLKEATFIWRSKSIIEFLEAQHMARTSDSLLEVCSLESKLLGVRAEALERALLKFAQGRIVLIFLTSLPPNPHLFWIPAVGKYFPGLSRRGGVTIESEEVFPAQHIAKINVLVMSPDGKWVASGSRDGTIILRDFKSGVNVRQWVGAPYHDSRHCSRGVTSLAFSPDGRCLVSGGGGTKAIVWDLSSGGVRQVATLPVAHHADSDYNVSPPHVSVCSWSPDGKTIATGFHDGTTLLWDAHTFRQLMLGSSMPLTGSARSLTFSPDGRWLACTGTSSAGECAILDVGSRTLRKYLWGEPVPPRASAISDSTGYRSSRLDPSLEWRYLRPHFADDSPTTVVAFDPKSARLATTAPTGRFEGLAVTHLVKGETKYLFRVEGASTDGRWHDILFSPDGKLLLGAAMAGTVYVWDARTGRELFRLTNCVVNARKVRFSACGEHFASISKGDRRVWVRGTSDGKLCTVAYSEHEDQVEHIVFSPDSTRLSSAARNGETVIRRIYTANPNMKNH